MAEGKPWVCEGSAGQELGEVPECAGAVPAAWEWPGSLCSPGRASGIIPVDWLEKLNYRYAVGMLVTERRDVLCLELPRFAWHTHKVLPNCPVGIWERFPEAAVFRGCDRMMDPCPDLFPPHVGSKKLGSEFQVFIGSFRKYKIWYFKPSSCPK